MRVDTRAHVDALTHVERLCVEPVEAVYPRSLGDRVERVGRELRRKGRPLEDALHRSIDLGFGLVAIQRLHKFPQDARVSQRAVAVGAGERMPRDHRVEIVRAHIGVEPARELHGAKDLRRKRAPEAGEFVLEKAVVETRVMGDKESARYLIGNLIGDLAERRRLGNHGATDAGQRLDCSWNAAFRIDQGTPLADSCALIDADDPDFGHPIGLGGHAGRFEVDEGDRGGEHG